LYGLRLLILGLGLRDRWDAVVNLDPASRITAKILASSSSSAAVTGKCCDGSSLLKAGQEIMPLRTVVQQLVAKNTKMIPGSFQIWIPALPDLNAASTLLPA